MIEEIQYLRDEDDEGDENWLCSLHALVCARSRVRAREPATQARSRASHPCSCGLHLKALTDGAHASTCPKASQCERLLRVPRADGRGHRLRVPRRRLRVAPQAVVFLQCFLQRWVRSHTHALWCFKLCGEGVADLDACVTATILRPWLAALHPFRAAPSSDRSGAPHPKERWWR